MSALGRPRVLRECKAEMLKQLECFYVEQRNHVLLTVPTYRLRANF
jgi:hypothetical protein